MLIAITGTPGTGKSSAAEKLREMGYRVASVAELAEKYGCIEGEEEGEVVVDVDKLERIIRSIRFEGIVEGHLSHLLKPEIAIVLRCHPEELKRRLEAKGWREDKVMENVEAELLDVILVEALESPAEVFEIDTTNMKAEEVAAIIDMIIKGDKVIRKKYLPGKIDWLSEVGERIEEFTRKV